ncbi:putative metalloprotease with PDZ domain [Sphingobacterium allocomposti]|uniref:Putative metalloprotease with PDZ domain n=1 Tax=Sphingobacterium allocomposti TaxID=415956 RepID=A0A5S5CY66_9SPHI|nr:PDZ domain-containing protein [Sphingobacterium composti Yoo et al. 2007 non Ten et al. 2007]TYP88720.1 putative metalloprotease with PDZ domain [Sphingobacterium composti Yoo et al. 2007 non Ten et al. 2007]
MSESRIHFTISFCEPQAHYVEIEMDISGFPSGNLDLKMPVWTPGSYLIREFARHIECLTAESDNNLLQTVKQNKNTWRVVNHEGSAKISYRVYGFEASVRTNFINIDHAFLSPAATFLYPDGYIDHPSTVTINLPAQWTTVSTGLPRLSKDIHLYQADNFDILFDSPIEIGNQDTWQFEAAGVQHEFAMVGGGNYDKRRLTEDITRIVEEETAIWGENPNRNYVFITHNYQTGSGGLEHLNSTVLGASRNAYQSDTAYKNFLSLVAHEYFHLWNVKRLRPAALGPFNYNEENYTEGLWIMEGFTAYYDNLVIRRCGLLSVEEYLNMLATEFNLVYNRPGYRIQSAALASFDTWIKQYRPDENTPNTSISYYNKGAMLAAALDVQIIAGTNGQKRLDDVLRAAYAHFFKAENRGFEEQEFAALAEAITGVDLSDIFEAAHSVAELDYNFYFNKVGYELVDLLHDSTELSLGIRTTNQDGRIIIKHVERGSGAWDAGLNVDDELIAINGNRADTAGKELEFLLNHGKVDDIADIMVARDGLIRIIHTPLRKTTKQQWAIQEKKNASERERDLGRIWLSA